MCTLTIIPLTDAIGRATGYRAMMSRDELRTRPPALIPAERRAGRIRAIWPTDTLAGGTWFAASERGLTLGLLNVNLGDHEPATVAPRTRGELIPQLIDRSTVIDVLMELRSMPLDRYRPFRLVAIGREGVVDARWDRGRLVETRRSLSASCFVSSGLGDHMVEPRLMLFESMFCGAAPTPLLQEAFHRHVWPKHEHLSVMLSRDDARTTSVTLAEVAWRDAGAPAVTMTHRDDDGETHTRLEHLEAATC